MAKLRGIFTMTEGYKGPCENFTFNLLAKKGKGNKTVIHISMKAAVFPTVFI